MNERIKRKEWVKTAAIIFLSAMLVLTFFSNTIMNYSLPEVATQYVQPGTITAKVRGTGNVEATDPYNVMVEESRVIASVAVKQGDTVEKDQVLYYLEDAESEELKTAEEELETLELTYMKGLFGGTVSPEVISKVANGNVSSFSSFQAQVTDMQNRIQEAENRVKECQKAVDDLTLQSEISTNDAGVSTIPDELAQDQATTDLKNAEAHFNKKKEERLAEIDEQIHEVEYQISDLEKLIKNAQDAGSSGGGSGATPPATDSTVDLRKADVEAKIEKIKDEISSAPANTTFPDPIPFPGEKELSAWYNSLIWENMDEETQKNCEAFYGEYRVAVDLYNQAVDALDKYGDNANQLARLSELENQLAKLNNKKAEVSAITVSSSDSVKDAQSRLDQATRNITEITNANKQSSAAYANKLANANAALKNAQAVLELVKAEQTEMAANINAELDLSKASRDIAEKKKEIAKLKEKSMGAAITAPVAGMVTNLAYVAGETTKPEQAAAVIQVEGKGFTVSFSVTNEQARQVQVGDVAELQNAWYYEDVQAVVSAIKPDPESAGQKKLLVFDVTGSSIQAGQALNLSVGQRSAEYELVVPNSAIREDSNGKFILIVESKSSPLGNRYVATRVDVEELASDDNNTAISAGLYGYEYVITTSTKPVEAGKQVRLNDADL